jgi:hypothetical protein
MKSNRSQQPVLGVMVTSRSVEAVLLHASDDGPVAIRRFTRHRSAGHTRAGGMDILPPETESSNTGDDFTIQFGDLPAGGSEMFLGSEFAGLEGGGDEGGSHAPASFDLELTDILAECRDAGYADPVVAFAVGTTEVQQIEMRLPGDGRKRPDRSKLVKLLSAQHDGPVDEERVGFVAMTSTEEGEMRFLALIPRVNDAVSATLQALKGRKDVRMPAVRLVDTESTLYLGLARAALRLYREVPQLETAGDAPDSARDTSASPRTTLVIRAGVDDTLVMFLRGDAPMYIERLRSLTSADSPDTICSRILLQQDEYGVGEVHHVLVLSADRERDLVESFKMFFPDALVERLAEHVPSGTEIIENDGGRAIVPASAAGLRIVGGKRHEGVFEPVNFVVRKYTRRAPKLPFTWHVAVMAVLLFASVFFFGVRYASLTFEIADHQERLREYPPQIADTDIRALQSRIDSLRGTSTRYLHALDVLDTLMVGSDKWSRALEETAGATSAVAGIWVETWRPSGQSRVRLSGNSTSRDRIVRLAERMEGHIESLTFSEIREFPVYSFVIDIPLSDELPEAARYLRDQARLQAENAARQAARAEVDDRVDPPMARTSFDSGR